MDRWRPKEGKRYYFPSVYYGTQIGKQTLRWKPLSGWHGLPYQEESIGVFSKASGGIERGVTNDENQKD